ncbi:MAG: LacI family DNA-binding transcriptional regulator [Anaeromyxobacter sp.]
MATIKDVAALAGVSYTTVSHVLNETRPVLPGTRERVLAAARKLDYEPSAVARSLKHQVTHTVGLLVPNSTNPYFAELARGIEDACFAAGHSLILCSSDDEPERQAAYLRLLRQKRVDGIVVASASDEPRWVGALRDLRLPLVVVDRGIGGLSADLVQVDNERGGALAAEHLLSLGHEAIACITGPPGLSVDRDRLRGFRRALAAGGVKLPEGRVLESDFTAPGGRKAALELLERTPRLTALFVFNDLMAIGALRAAAELGLPVPGRLSVVGFDDVELSRYVYPSLTTVGQSIRKLGEATVEALFARAARREEAPRRVRLRPMLHARESTGPAPGAAQAKEGRRTP